MTAIYDRTGSEHSILTKGETIPSIERRLKWKDGLHPGNGSIGILDEDSYVFIEMLKKVLCLNVQLSSHEWQSNDRATQALEHARGNRCAPKSHGNRTGT